MVCALIALSAAKHENVSKKTKRGTLTGAAYNSYGYAQPSLSHGAGQVVQSYAAQPAVAYAAQPSVGYASQSGLSHGGGSVVSSYGGQASYRSSFAAAPVAQTYATQTYAAQPAVSYAAQPAVSYAAAAPVLRTVHVQQVPQVVVRERYPVQVNFWSHNFS